LAAAEATVTFTLTGTANAQPLQLFVGSSQVSEANNQIDPFNAPPPLRLTYTFTEPSSNPFGIYRGIGKFLGWTPTAASTFYTGSLSGQTYTVNGSDGITSSN
jgi:hypothetical protein